MFDNIKKSLEENGYSVFCFETKEEAAQHILQTAGKTIGIGGSQTIKQLDIYEKLKESNTVYWHDIPDYGMSMKELREKALNTQIYFSSVNGMSEKGELVNIDNNSNRVAGTLYGHEKVVFVIGKNKIADTLENAIYRARNIAGPLNCRRLNRKTPCAVNADKCYDCNSPERLCRSLVVLWKKPAGCDYEVILVNEDLGY